MSVVDRARSSGILVHDATIPDAVINALLDTEGVPDGTPFVTDALGQFHTLRHVNAYLLEAARQRAYPLDALRSKHAAAFARLLSVVRDRQRRRPSPGR